MKSVLFINRVYPPAEGATGQLLAEIAGQLARAGWTVTVLTTRFDANSPLSEVEANGVRIERVRALPFTRANLLHRAFSYVSLHPRLLWRSLRLRSDIVVTMTDPPLQVLLGALLQIVGRTRHVHWAQDIYPELAEELGMLKKGGVIAGLLRRLSTWAMRRADAVLAVGECMKTRLRDRGLPTERIQVIPNWAVGVGDADEESIRRFRLQHGFEDRFVVMYSGNLGLAHEFSGILEAAVALQSERPEVLLAFLGGGARLEWLQTQVRIRGLRNVRFLPSQPKSILAVSLSAADVHLACMREELCGLVVPSKVYGPLAAGRLCIFAGPGQSEAAQAILRSGMGSVTPAHDGAAIAGKIKSFQRSCTSPRGVRQLDVTTALQSFIATLERICHPPMIPKPAGLSRRICKLIAIDSHGSRSCS